MHRTCISHTRACTIAPMCAVCMCMRGSLRCEACPDRHLGSMPCPLTCMHARCTLICLQVSKVQGLKRELRMQRMALLAQRKLRTAQQLAEVRAQPASSRAHLLASGGPPCVVPCLPLSIHACAHAHGSTHAHAPNLTAPRTAVCQAQGIPGKPGRRPCLCAWTCRRTSGLHCHASSTAGGRRALPHSCAGQN